MTFIQISAETAPNYTVFFSTAYNRLESDEKAIEKLFIKKHFILVYMKLLSSTIVLCII